MASVALGTKSVGSIVKLKENGAAVNYIVVHQGKPSSSYDSSCDGTWLLRQDIAENRAWDSGNSNVLESSDIHSYLNNSWINRYDTDIRNAIKQTLRGAGCIFIAAAQRVGVHFQRGAGVGVAQARGHGHDVDAVGQQDGGVGVSKIVKADAFKSVGIGKAPEPFGWRIMVEPRTVPAVNDPPFPFPEITGPCLYLFLIFPCFMKHGHHAGRQRD